MNSSGANEPQEGYKVITENGTIGWRDCLTKRTMAIQIHSASNRMATCRGRVFLWRWGLTAAVLCAGVFARGANWREFRGSGAQGVEDSRATPTYWNVETGENIRWRTPVPGLAHASPIVWGERV